MCEVSKKVNNKDMTGKSMTSSGAVNVKFEQISHLYLMFLLLILNRHKLEIRVYPRN